MSGIISAGQKDEVPAFEDQEQRNGQNYGNTYIVQETELFQISVRKIHLICVIKHFKYDEYSSCHQGHIRVISLRRL